MANNTPGLGIEFEVLAPAYFCLKLINNANVENFSVRTNEKGFGNLDDLLFDIELKNGKELFFAFQLKHAGSTKNITPDRFYSKGDFDLRKYCQTFSNFDQAKRKKYHIVLYTNRQFDHKKMGEVEKFVMQPQQHCPGEIFFATSSGENDIYKFANNDKDDEIFNQLDKESYDQFFDQFSLYVAQYNQRDFQNKIKEYFQGYDYLADSFISFFRDWHKGEFCNNRITKETVENNLLGRLLNNSLITNSSLFQPRTDGYKNILEDAVNCADITLVEGLTVQQLVKENDNTSCDPDLGRVGKDLKLITRYAGKLSKEEEDNVLRFSGRKPFLIEFSERSRHNLQAALDLLVKNKHRKHNLKLVIFGKKIDSSQLSWDGLNVFENLHDLHTINASLFDEVMQKFQISLQGKKNICLRNVMNFEATKLIKIVDLLNSLNDNLIIGEKSETVFENYISRFVTAPCFSSQFLLKLKSDFLVINCGLKLKQIKKELHKNTSNKEIMEIQEVSSTTCTSLKDEIILIGDDLVLQNFRKEFAEFRGNVHYFKTVGEDSFQWIETQGDIQNLRSDAKLKEPNKVPEEDILTNFKNKVNVICAQPGMGKSVMMERFRINSPPDFWAVKMEFRELESLFEKFTDNFEENFNNFEDEFLKKTIQNDLQTQIVHVLKERQKLYFLFDGLDELQSKHLVKAINFLKELSSRGFMLWISARKNLQDKLEINFNVLALNIEEIPEENQKHYVKQRLRNSHDPQEIQEVIQKVFNNLQVLNNSEVLGVPLQLFILTEVLIEEKKDGCEFDEKMFVMTKMYESFFRGKIQHYLDKNPSKSCADLVLESVNEHYEKAALKSCLDEEFFESLNIQGFDRSLKWISEDVSKVGIVTKIINGRPVFHHNTHGEYFAACYFARNREGEYEKNYLFQAKYRNIRLMLDIKFAENSEPHLSVIYKDFEKLTTFDKKQINCKDQAGRSPLHLACSYGEIFPILNVKENVIQDADKYDINESNLDLWRKFVKFLLENNCSPFEKDDFFKLDAMQYADASLSLSALEEIVRLKSANKRQFIKNFKKNLSNYSTAYSCIIYYCAKFNFLNLFGLVKHSRYTSGPLKYFFNRGFSTLLKIKNQENETLLHIAVESKRLDLVKLILAEPVVINLINAVDIYGRTPLDTAILVQDSKIEEILELKGARSQRQTYPFHAAAANGCDKIIKLLLSQQSDYDLINSVDARDWTALHYACSEGHLLTCELLINSSASIEAQTQMGDTPLLLSAKHCYLEIMKLLLIKGANVNSSNSINEHVIHAVIGKDDVEALKILLDAKVDIRAKDNVGREALHFAAGYGKLEAMKFLLDAKADIRAKDIHGNEALHFAAVYGKLEAMKVLLDAKADIRAKDNDGREALHFAAWNGKIEAMKFLLDAKVDIRAKDNDGRETLHFAARNGEIEAMKFLLDANADIRAKDIHGNEALHFAAVYGKLEAMKFLLDAKADIRAKDNDGREALHFAAWNGKIEAMKFLLDAKVDIRATDNNGTEALHFAARNGEIEAMKFLLDANADIRAKDNDGRETLHFAARNGEIEAMKFLLDANADIRAKDNDGRETLHFAARNGEIEAMKFLLDANADIRAKDNDGREALHFAAWNGKIEAMKFLLDAKVDIRATDNNGTEALHFAARNGEIESMKFLLDANADIRAKDNDGREALHFATWNGKIEAMKLLLDANADIRAKDNDGREALHFAAENGEIKEMKFLLEANADIRAKDNDGREALHFAAVYGKLEAMKFLLDAKADIRAKDNIGTEALHFAAWNGKIEAMKILLDAKADIRAKDIDGSEALHFAAVYGKLEAMKFLLDAKVDIRAKDNDGEEALHLAARNGEIEVMKFLLDAKVDIRAKDNDGREALHFAAENGEIKEMKFILDANADIRAKDNDGREALHFAARNGKIKALKFLLDAKVDIRAKDNDGREALHFAAENGEIEEMKFLLDAKADIRAKDNDGREALHFAASNGKIEAMKFLLDANADIRAKVNNGTEALHFAAANGEIEAMKFLLDAKADIRAKDNDGKGALHFAADNGKIEAMKFLLDAKADLTAVTCAGESVLHLALASYFNNYPLVKFLIDQKVNVNAVDNNGHTPLQVAYRPSDEIVKALTDAGAKM